MSDLLRDSVRLFCNAESKYIMLSSKTIDEEGVDGYPYIASNANGDSFVVMFASSEIANEYTKKKNGIISKCQIGVLEGSARMFVRLLFALMNNGVDSVVIMDRPNHGVSCDILRMIQLMDLDLDSSMNQYLIPTIPLVGQTAAMESKCDFA